MIQIMLYVQLVILIAQNVYLLLYVHSVNRKVRENCLTMTVSVKLASIRNLKLIVELVISVVKNVLTETRIRIAVPAPYKI